MRILLFAYEFPPILAAQSLRWYYLVNELAKIGFELDVLTPLVTDIWGFNPEFEDSVRIYRCFPGPFFGFSGWLGKRLRSPSVITDACTAVIKSPHWRQYNILERIYRTLRRVQDQIFFPDSRSEWLPFAWHSAQGLYVKNHYDLVISSHEPGVDLLLGLRAHRKWGIPWIADLADPLLTPYTPRWRTHWDRKLERQVCQTADAILTTTEGVNALLSSRHDVPVNRFNLIRQGFDHRYNDYRTTLAPSWSRDSFVLLFTGTFYFGFRDPGPLIQALERLDNVEMVFVGDMGPFMEDLQCLGSKVKLFGKLPHDVCLSWQRHADILVNLGNKQDDQVPGKIYEYLGACRPILHISSSISDPVPSFLDRFNRGRTARSDVNSIITVIRGLRELWDHGLLDRSFDLSMDSVMDYSWMAQASRLCDLISGLGLGTGFYNKVQNA